MAQVMVEAYEIVEHGYMTADDFRDFSFGNGVEMHTGMNPAFFKGTAVEADVEKFKTGNTTADSTASNDRAGGGGI
ncbi:MAG: hypothetical protein OEU26_22960 [Candidatus Tectomicrobia bacterium]|nr:hypothetical protein [Candidatus Tectomicrobia bacterium]